MGNVELKISAGWYTSETETDQKHEYSSICFVALWLADSC